MDCVFADKTANMHAILTHLRTAADAGARLVIFPEACLTGYGFASKEDALPFAEPVPGPSTRTLLDSCRELRVWAVIGMLEARASDEALFNVAVLLGPDGECRVYRKIHLPFLGVDRFTTPGDQPFAVHDIGGLRVGMSICYDGSFPESARCLMLLGAELIVLPTNWPDGARGAARLLVPARALENTVYYAAVDRIGDEKGFHFIGQSRIVGCAGQVLAEADHDRFEILYADIEPANARRKHIVFAAGEYELDRIAHRRPDMYAPLVQPVKKA